MILYLGNKLSMHGFTPTSVETLGPKLAALNLTVETRSSKRNMLLRMTDMLWSVWKFRNQKPVVLIDTYSTSAFWYAYAAAYLCNILKVVYVPVLRGGDLPCRLDKSPRASSRIFHKSFANVAVSGYLHQEFSKRHIPVITIHNYLELANYPFTLRTKTEPKLLWVRAFHKIYNPLLALEVLLSLREQYPDASLCMVGPDKDGSLEDCKSFAAKWNLNVSFTGRLQKEEWIRRSKNYDIFINTTNVDNTPVSVMEAMALGMPVITTDAGGIPYLFSNGSEGVMVCRNNVEVFTQAITSLLADPVKTENISKSARSKSESWDWAVVGPHWQRLIESAESIKP